MRNEVLLRAPGCTGLIPQRGPCDRCSLQRESECKSAPGKHLSRPRPSGLPGWSHRTSAVPGSVPQSQLPRGSTVGGHFCHLCLRTFAQAWARIFPPSYLENSYASSPRSQLSTPALSHPDSLASPPPAPPHSLLQAPSPMSVALLCQPGKAETVSP